MWNDVSNQFIMKWFHIRGTGAIRSKKSDFWRIEYELFESGIVLAIHIVFVFSSQIGADFIRSVSVHLPCFVLLTSRSISFDLSWAKTTQHSASETFKWAFQASPQTLQAFPKKMARYVGAVVGVFLIIAVLIQGLEDYYMLKYGCSGGSSTSRLSLAGVHSFHRQYRGSIDWIELLRSTIR